MNSNMTKAVMRKSLSRVIAGVDLNGFFFDEHWRPVVTLLNAFNTNGFHYTMKTAYQTNEVGVPVAKVWKLTFPFQNVKGKEEEVYVNITASGGGSVEDPLSRYDVVAYVAG